MKTTNTGILVENAQNGSRAAFDQLLNSYYSRLLNTIKARVGNEEDAKDILQTVCLKAYTRLKSFKHTCSFYTWIYAITLNSIKDHWKSLKQRHVTEHIDIASIDNSTLESQIEDSSSPEELLLVEEREVLFHKILNRLPNKLSVTAELHCKGISYKNIAEKLKIPIKTVASRIHAISNKLQYFAKRGPSTNSHKFNDLTG